MDAETLKDAIQATMSPEAVALMIAHLQVVTGESDAAREVDWFVQQLFEVVGGADAANRLFDEIGV